MLYICIVNYHVFILKPTTLMNYQILFILIATFLAFSAVLLAAPNNEEDNPPNDNSNATSTDDNEETLKIAG